MIRDDPLIFDNEHMAHGGSQLAGITAVKTSNAPEATMGANVGSFILILSGEKSQLPAIGERRLRAPDERQLTGSAPRP